jgi:hypothetical protein
MIPTFGMVPTYETLTEACIQGKTRAQIVGECCLCLLSKGGQETLRRVDNINIVLNLIRTRIAACSPFQTEEEIVKSSLLVTGLDFEAATRVTKAVVASNWIPMLEENCHLL